TVIHSGDYIQNDSFLQIIVKEFKIGPFYYKNLPNLMSYDVVINMQNIRFIHTWLFVFKFININRLVDWTIGTSTKNGLNRKITILDKMRDFLSKYSQAIILYTNYARFKYSKSNQNKIFI